MLSKVFSKGVNGSGNFVSRTDGNVTSQSSTGAVRVWVDSHFGSDNPNWRNQIKAGQNATTGASGSRRNYNFGSGVANFNYYGDLNHISKVHTQMTGIYITGNPDFADDAGVLDPSRADSDARVKILARCREVQRQFQGGTFLGELRETLQMIRRPAQALRSSIDRYSVAAKKAARSAWKKNPKQDREKSRAAQKAVTDTWLEHSFGWRPLFSDVDDAARLLANAETRQLIPVQSQGIAEIVVDSPASQQFGFHGVTYTQRKSGTATVRYKGACVAESSNPTPWTFKKWGLTLDNFVPTVWNLIPYSFLVDYFTNVGQVIDGWSLSDAGIAWMNKTVYLQSKVEILDVKADQALLAAFIGAQHVISTDASYSGYQNSSTVFFRSAPSDLSVGINDIHFRIPGVSSTKWLNIAALAGSRRV